MHIDRRPVTLELRYLQVEEIHLDRENPRLRALREKAEAEGRTLTEEECARALWKLDEVKSLYHGIIASGGLSEPLLLRSNLVAKDGNERLVALQHIAADLDEGDKFTEEDRPALEALVKSVPCKVMSADVTKREMDMLLALLHVGGRADWDAFSQAAHLYELNERDALSAKEIATLIRKSEPYVHQKLKAYEWTKQYLDKYGHDRVSDFSFFEELYKRRAALKKEAFDVDTKKDFERFMTMVADRSLAAALDVRKLPDLLRHPKTKRLIESGEAKKALQIIGEVSPAASSPRFAALGRARDAVRNLTYEDLQALSESDAHRHLVEDLIKTLQKLLTDAERV